jgi:hypothetical protein
LAKGCQSVVGMNDCRDALERLSSRVDELEGRVHALEHPSEKIAPASDAAFTSSFALKTDESAAEETSGAFALLGRGMLGIAGAYVLRAVAESHALPRTAVAGVAVAYATAWLVWAGWSRTAGRLAQAVYAGASVVILAPMLWELTLHFKTFSALVTAAILAAYAALPAIIQRKRDAAPVAWVAQGAVAVTALFLGVATHAPLPFIATLLLLVALCEYAAVRRGREGVRPLVLLVSDIAIWGMIFIYSGPLNARADYPNLDASALIAPAWLLWAINGTSLTVRSVFLQKRVAALEAIQAMVSFALAVSSVLFFAPKSGTRLLGLACLLLAAACYTAVFRRFLPWDERRNVLVFGSWSAALAIAGVAWCMLPGPAAVCLALGALAAVAFGTRLRCAMLEFHGLLFLVSAAVISGTPQYAFGELAGSAPPRPGLLLIAVTVCTVLFYGLIKERSGEEWQQQFLHLVSSLLACFALSALIVQGLLGVAASVMHLGAHHIAFIRTFTLCAVSAVFAFGGSRWSRPEMTRIAYVGLAFVAAKLLFEDLRHGRMEFIAGSISLFALTLITVPRLARKGTKTRTAGEEATVPQKRA